MMIRSLMILLFVLLMWQENLKGQFQETAPGTYVLFLSDKNGTSFQLSNPGVFLSAKALSRRYKQGIAIDSSDLPVNKFYTDSLLKLGVQIHNVSRWFNSVSFKTDDAKLLDKLQTISFVRKKVKATLMKLQTHELSTSMATDEMPDSTAYGRAYTQVHIHNGEYRHNKGYKGEDILIAIIDAGFNSYETMTAFRDIRTENRIKGVKDFVTHDADVNADYLHGAQVFSIIGGEVKNSFMGTAPKASFLLLRSEDASTEFLVEEDNWISAAEYADSLGADLITTSLGYSTFNNPVQNHSYEDMNGATTRISIAAETATKKGMIVVASAGNEGSSSWKYISAPADAPSVLTVGAVDTDLMRAGFSSVGPSSDNRIKPDVMGVGKGTILQNTSSQITSGNGTSYSTPVIAGLTACLWQSAYDKSNLEIIDAIRRSSDRFLSPDNYYGYGIPDFKKACLFLNPDLFEHKGKLFAYPNPFNSELTIQHEALNTNTIYIEIFNTSGKKIFGNEYPIVPGVVGEIQITGVASIERGIVFIRGIAGSKVLTTKAIKL